MNEIKYATSLSINEKYSAAAAEYLKALPELRKIHSHKINPANEFANQNQQAGFAAEILHVANTNADNAMHAKTIRIQRTDLLGFVNDPVADYVAVDSKGKPIKDSSGNFILASQSKFLKDPNKYSKLLSDKWYNKYKKTFIDVPKDQYEEILQNFKNKLVLEKKNLHINRNSAESKERIKRIQDISNRLRPSSLTKAEALYARKHPTITVFKKAGWFVTKSGIESAKSAALSTAITSGLRNFFGGKSTSDALETVLLDTSLESLKEFARTTSTTALTSTLQSSNNELIRSLGSGNTPVLIAQIGKSIAENTIHLLDGSASAQDCLQNIHQDYSTLATSLYGGEIGATIGTAIIPGLGTIIGGFIGSTVSSIASQATYNQLRIMTQDVRHARYERDCAKEIAKNIIQREENYRRTVLEPLKRTMDYDARTVSYELDSIFKAIGKGQDPTSHFKNISSTLHLDTTYYTKNEFKERVRKNKALKL